MKDYPWGKGTPCWVRDATANDNSKQFAVPTGKWWNVHSFYLEYSASADVGNRQIRIGIYDSSNNLLHLAFVSPALTATQFGRVIGLPGASSADRNDPDTNTDRDVGLPLPCILPAGYYVKVHDAANVAAAADDILIVLHYTEYDA